MIDTIQLYTKEQDATYNVETQGILHGSKHNKDFFLHSNFKIELKPYETKEFFYKSYSISSANYFELYLKDNKNLKNDEFTNQAILLVFFGCMIALIIYNSIVYYFTKEKYYLYYVLFIFIATWNHSSYTTINNYIIPTEYLKYETFFATYYVSLTGLFALLFINSILNLNRYKYLNIISNIFIIFLLIIMMINSVSNYLIEVSAILGFVIMLYIQIAIIFAYIKKLELSSFILVGWTLNSIGLVSLIFVQYEIPNFIDFFKYFYETTIFFEAMIFSIALASKLNKTKELEISLNTNEKLLADLNHRVKNNMQLIIFAYRQKLRKFKTKELFDTIEETERLIHLLNEYHDLLYKQKDLKDDSKHIPKVLNKLKETASFSDINLSYQVDTNIKLEDSLYLSLILNELLTNSMKYAFENLDNKKVHIKVFKENKKHELVYQDNGQGFDYENVKDKSFGLGFITDTVEKELKGEIKFNTKKNTLITIRF